MHQYIFFLGSNPTLSATECFRVLTAQDYDPAIISASCDILHLGLTYDISEDCINRLGGIDRIAVPIGTFDAVPTPQDVLRAISPLPPKFSVGISSIGVDFHIKRFALALKQFAKSNGSKLSYIVPSRKSRRLNAAQVIFNSLHKKPHAEITIINNPKGFTVSRTIQIQDIQSYELRDTRRPARNARVGMLPPKLAQIMINIASTERYQSLHHKQDSSPLPLRTLDPFCGTGTILQEGWLLGHCMFGSDSSATMVASSKKNLAWISKNFSVDPNVQPTVVEHDVMRSFPPVWDNSFDAIITEPHLGKPRTTPPSHSEFNQSCKKLHDLYVCAFRKLIKILKIRGVILFIFPFVNTPDGNVSFPYKTIDTITHMGYSQLHLVPEEIQSIYKETKRRTIMYSRPDAVIGRELILFRKQ